HPAREGLRALLMTALHRAGRPAEALGVFQDARRVLADELGSEPGPALQRLHRLVLRDSTAAPNPARRAASPSTSRETGPNRTADAAPPRPGAPATLTSGDATPSRAAAPGRAGRPAAGGDAEPDRAADPAVVQPGAPAALAGRDAELGLLRRAVSDAAAGRGRCLWIEGEPGIGKSALLAAGLAGAADAGRPVARAAGGGPGPRPPPRPHPRRPHAP